MTSRIAAAARHGRLSLGLLSLTMPPVEAATLIVVPTLATTRGNSQPLLPVFAGMYTGQLVRIRLHAEAYRKWFFMA